MATSEHPHLRIRSVDGVAVVRLVDAEIIYEEAVVRALNNEFIDLLDRQGYTKLLFDFQGVRYISSSMLAMLVAVQRKVRQSGGRLRLCGLGPTVRDIFSVSQLDRFFEIDDDEPSALARLNG
jgi:anti-sigma B factor antagonist